jgi:hypothetical protein
MVSFNQSGVSGGETKCLQPPGSCGHSWWACSCIWQHCRGRIQSYSKDQQIYMLSESYTGQQNLTFFLSHEETYLILTTFNAEFKYVSSFFSITHGFL